MNLGASLKTNGSEMNEQKKGKMQRTKRRMSGLQLKIVEPHPHI